MRCSTSCTRVRTEPAVTSFREALRATMPSSQRIVIDLSGVTSLDSAGVGVIVSALGANRERQANAVALVGPTGMVLRVLTISLTTLFPVCVSLEEAISQPA